MYQSTLPFSIPVKRGCGVRVEGGIYIVTTAEIEELADYMDISDANIEGKLVIFPKPYPTLVNLKPFRGFRGFDKKRFFYDLQIEKLKLFGPPRVSDPSWKMHLLKRVRLKNCYYAHPEDSHAWLHWIGNQYYSIKSFIKEARLIGVSRRVPVKALKKMKWGDTIFLASKQKNLKNPVIFGYFRLEKLQGIKVNINELPEHLRDKMKYEKEEL